MPETQFPRSCPLGSSENQVVRPLARCNRFGYDTKEGPGVAVEDYQPDQICTRYVVARPLIPAQYPYFLDVHNVNRAHPKLDYAYIASSGAIK